MVISKEDLPLPISIHGSVRCLVMGLSSDAREKNIVAQRFFRLEVPDSSPVVGIELVQATHNRF